MFRKGGEESVITNGSLENADVCSVRRQFISDNLYKAKRKVLGNGLVIWAQDLRVFGQQHYPIQVKLCILEDARESRVISSSLRDDRDNHILKVRLYAVVRGKIVGLRLPVSVDAKTWQSTHIVNYISHPNFHVLRQPRPTTY